MSLMSKSMICVTGDGLNGPEVLLDCSAPEFSNDSRNSCIFCHGNPMFLKGLDFCPALRIDSRMDLYNDYPAPTIGSGMDLYEDY